jgi:hypothetical protein
VEQYGLQQLTPEAEMPQFCKNTVVSDKGI